MPEVGGPRVAEDQDVIEEDEDAVMQERPEDVVHDCLERGQGISQPERHDQELVEPIMRLKRRLGNVSGEHPDLVVPRAEVQLGEEAGSEQLVEELIHHWDGVGVLNGDGVQGAVVDTETSQTIGLLEEDDRRCALPNDALG